MTHADPTVEETRTSEVVIEAIADQEGVDPLEFDVPLGEVVDPDALDSMFDPQYDEPRKQGRVEFTYREYRVTVVSAKDGVSVDVEPAEETAHVGSSVGAQEA